MVFGGGSADPDVASDDTSIALESDNEKDEPAASTDENESVDQPSEPDTSTDDTEQTADEPESSNILIAAAIQTADVMNGTRDKKSEPAHT